MVNTLKAMDGNECWTDAFSNRFGERVCVMVKYPDCVHDGKSFRPTAQEKKELWTDFIERELGSPSQIAKDLEEEFGKRC